MDRIHNGGNMKLSIITDAYELEVNRLIRDCKATISLETLKLIEKKYWGERSLLGRLICNTREFGRTNYHQEDKARRSELLNG